MSVGTGTWNFLPIRDFFLAQWHTLTKLQNNLLCFHASPNASHITLQTLQFSGRPHFTNCQSIAWEFYFHSFTPGGQICLSSFPFLHPEALIHSLLQVTAAELKVILDRWDLLLLKAPLIKYGQFNSATKKTRHASNTWLVRYSSTDQLAMNGVTVGGTKYMFLSANDRVVRARKGQSGVHCIKTVQGTTSLKVGIGPKSWVEHKEADCMQLNLSLGSSPPPLITSCPPHPPLITSPPLILLWWHLAAARSTARSYSNTIFKFEKYFSSKHLRRVKAHLAQSGFLILPTAATLNCEQQPVSETFPCIICSISSGAVASWYSSHY